MSDNSVFEVPAAFAKTAKCGSAKYEKMYKQSISDPDKFWGREGKSALIGLNHIQRSRTRKYGKKSVSIKWFEDGKLNVAANCIDRHLAKRGEQTAIIFRGR